MKAKRSNPLGLIVLLLAGAVGVFAVGAYIKHTPEAQDVPAPLLRRSSPPETTDRPTHQQPTVPSSATVLIPSSSGGNLTFDEKTEKVPDGSDPIVFAINRYLENTHFVPDNARAVGCNVKDGIAFISFTEGMQQKTYGSSDEATLLQGICKTLSHFPSIDKVQFEIEGKPMDPIGNVDISVPLDVKTPPDAAPTQPGA